MTQPPNQPPQGGFGAPQDPQQPQDGAPGQPPQTPPPPAGQPGYGYPQTPPAPQPGYGYPQNAPGQPGPYGTPPPTQPGQAGPYGTPPPTQPGQPGPYGAQQGPYNTQPQYGYQQPTTPGGPGFPGTPPPGGGGGRNFFKGKPAMIIAAALAAVVVIGGTVWAVTSGGDDDDKPAAKKKDPKPSASASVNPGDGSGDGGEEQEDLNAGRQAGESKVLWYKEAPKAPTNGADAPGMWVQDGVVVKAAYKQLFSYDPETGKDKWGKTVDLPYKICGASRQPSSDGKIVVAYMSGTSDKAKCNTIKVIDLATGDSDWTKPVPKEGLFDIMTQLNLSISGDTVTATRMGTSSAFSLTDGKKLFAKLDGSCQPDAYAGGDKLIAVETCGSDLEKEQVQEIDPAKGKAKWTLPVNKGWKVKRVYSTNPVVLYMENEKKKQWNISTLNDKGKVRSQVKVDETFAPECGWAVFDRDLQGCTGAVVADDTLYLPTEAKSGANEIVAIGLANGKEKWRKKSPSDVSMLPLKVEDGAVVAYVAAKYGEGGQVVSISTSGSHATKTLLKNPQGTAEIESSFYSKAIDYADGRFYISSTRIGGSSVKEGKEKLMIAYGSGK
ncbi:PQQ-binding-like beta-propeller repeat protein [Streptomyces sp. NPDC059009]|uniref:outer membrane protein assembly factor BamB family protein n=1 Tax=Streptomyces sp. NPDC059009 TaxID=3346694 RepID=UPI0036BB93E9